MGMWLTSIQVSPQTIGLMVDEFRWVWATEWIFFWLEVIAGYAFYRFASILPARTRLALLVSAIGASSVAAAIIESLLMLCGAAMAHKVHRRSELAGTPTQARAVDLGGGALAFALAAFGGTSAIVWMT